MMTISSSLMARTNWARSYLSANCPAVARKNEIGQNKQQGCQIVQGADICRLLANPAIGKDQKQRLFIHIIIECAKKLSEKHRQKATTPQQMFIFFHA